MAPENTSRTVRCIYGVYQAEQGCRRCALSATNLIVQMGIYLRRCLVHYDDVTSSQHSASHSDKLAFASTKRTSLANWHVQGNLGLARGMAQHG